MTSSTQLTAIANDCGANEVFVGQLRHRLRRIDALVAFSASGRSQNILAALSYGAEQGATPVLITGAAAIPPQAALGLALDCRDAAVAEDVFCVVVHALVALLVAG